MRHPWIGAAKSALGFLTVAHVLSFRAKAYTVHETGEHRILEARRSALRTPAPPTAVGAIHVETSARELRLALQRSHVGGFPRCCPGSGTSWRPPLPRITGESSAACRHLSCVVVTSFYSGHSTVSKLLCRQASAISMAASSAFDIVSIFDLPHRLRAGAALPQAWAN